MYPQRVIRAAVRVGSLETPYIRAGTGPPVLLVGALEECPAARARLWVSLARQFRVYAPVVPDAVASVGFSVWLSGFLDGLGTSALGLVVTGRLGASALAHALAHPWQIARLAILIAQPADASVPTVLRDRLVGSGLPILVLVGGCGAAHTPGALLRFLLESLDPR